MKAWGYSAGGYSIPGRGLQIRGLLLALGALLLLGSISVQAAPRVSIDSPVGFFTNVAARLLKSELNLDLNQIQVYPTNQYTPAVHRLLQLTANLYDCMTNRTMDVAPEGFPSVFQPILVKTPTSIIIAGYRDITDLGVDAATLVTLPALDLHDTNTINSLPSGIISKVAYGIPMVIGARKGFPNFNEFAMNTAVIVTRKLEFWKDTSLPITSLPQETNQMIIVGISNAFGAELWNSYSNAYPAGLRLAYRANVSAYLTNRYGNVVGFTTVGLPPGTAMYSYGETNMSLASYGIWSGSPNLSGGNVGYSFAVPLNTNWWHLPSAAWRPLKSPEQFELIQPATAVFDKSSFPSPQWWLNVRVQLQCALVDTTVIPQRIVDYVNLDAKEDPIDIAALLSQGAMTNAVQDGSPGSMWATNRSGGSGISVPTLGVLNQIAASRGAVAAYPAPPASEINAFRYNFNGSYPAGARTNHFFAPYVPIRTIYFGTSWQANDPLVHYTVGDLTGRLADTQRAAVDTLPAGINAVDNLRKVNNRYEPWGGGPFASSSATKTDLRVKDPLASRSDTWNLPVGASQNLTWLGRVHRGTPWQTLYLKSPGAELATWQKWAGGMSASDSQLTHPTNDWHLASLLLSILGTNLPASLASANQPDASAWTGLLDTIVVLTNTTDFTISPFVIPQFDSLLMQADSSQAWTIASAIDTLRAGQLGGYFQEPANILAAPELSVTSPWLNTSGSFVVARGISDEAYEAIPAQLLPRLRADSVGSLVQADGALSIQFSGIDDCMYAVEASSNLRDWTVVSTNGPVNGSFIYSEPPQPGAGLRFYRSVLLP